MALALAVTGLTAWYTANNESLLMAIFGNQAIFWVLIIAEFGLVIGISAAINRMSMMVATLMFLAYSVVNGLTMASIFIIYTSSSIAMVFFITAGMFAAMALIGFFVKKDLSSMGKWLMMLLIGIIIATVVNIFMKSEGLSLILSYAGVVVFLGLTIYDTNKIKNMLMQADSVNEQTQKIALLGALSLYLDFINLFLYLLRLLGDRR
jgi:FtsH-binding integral membrane protein